MVSNSISKDFFNLVFRRNSEFAIFQKYRQIEREKRLTYVAIDAEQMSAGEKAFDIFVVGVENHKDWRHFFVQPFHHGQRHSLAQVVPGKRYDIQIGFAFAFALLAFLHHSNVAIVIKKDNLSKVTSRVIIHSVIIT